MISTCIEQLLKIGNDLNTLIPNSSSVDHKIDILQPKHKLFPPTASIQPNDWIIVNLNHMLIFKLLSNVQFSSLLFAHIFVKIESFHSQKYQKYK